MMHSSGGTALQAADRARVISPGTVGILASSGRRFEPIFEEREDFGTRPALDDEEARIRALGPAILRRVVAELPSNFVVAAESAPGAVFRGKTPPVAPWGRG